MWAALRAGASFTAVARHGDHLAIGLQCVDNPQFLLRHDARKDVDVPNALREFFLTHIVKLRAANDRFRVIQADLSPDALGGGGIIPRNHDHPYPGTIALLDGCGNLRANRVGEADQAQELESDIMLAGRQVGRLNVRPSATARTRSPRPAIAATFLASSSFLGVSKWHRSAIASGAPLAATT